LPSSAGARMVRIVAACGLSMLAVPQLADAEWHVTPMLGVTFGGRTTLFDPQVAAGKHHVDFGGAVTLLGAGVIGAETIVVFTPGFFETDRTLLGTDTSRVQVKTSRTIAMMGNVVFTTPRRWTEYGLRPFVSGGMGMLQASQTQVTPVLPVHARLGGFNVGGGAIGFLSARTGVRFDLRYYGTLHGTDQGPAAIGLARLHYMTASVGLVLRR
jgi:hypothetical protein